MFVSKIIYHNATKYWLHTSVGISGQTWLSVQGVHQQCSDHLTCRINKHAHNVVSGTCHLMPMGQIKQSHTNGNTTSRVTATLPQVSDANSANGADRNRGLCFLPPFLSTPCVTKTKVAARHFTVVDMADHGEDKRICSYKLLLTSGYSSTSSVRKGSIFMFYSCWMYILICS